MIRLEGAFGLFLLGLEIFCLIDVISADEGRIRYLPKIPWLLIVLFFPLVGSVAWLVVGRPESGRARASSYERRVPDYPEYDRPGRAAATDAGADEEFLRRVRERAEEQRRRYREQRLREERERRGDEPVE